jgi:hypothetical protein
MQRKAVAGVRPRDYEHPFDARALRALEGNSALALTISKLNQYGIERVIRVQYTGSNIRATQRSFGEASDALAETCRILDLPAVPVLYVEWRDQPEALSAGTERPIVVLTSGLLGLLNYEELLFALGHEIGHIKSRHVIYNQIAAVMPVVGEIVKSATLGIGGLVSGGIQISLQHWQRMADFSADRSGMLACQDVEAAASALIKLGGLPTDLGHAIDVDGFLAQARELSGYDFETLDKLARVVSILWPHQSWTTMRASELIKWVDSGQYAAVLERRAAAEAGSQDDKADVVAEPGVAETGSPKDAAPRAGDPQLRG